MKRFLTWLLVATILLSFTACGNDDKTAANTCWNCGETISENAAYCASCGSAMADNPNNTETSTSETGSTEGNAAGHSWSAATCTAPKTCSKCGATEGNAAGHSWSAATCTAPKTCSKCGATEGNATGHSYSKTVTNATCTQQGYTTYTCSCGDSYKADYINPSHNYVNNVCTKCGEPNADYVAFQAEYVTLTNDYNADVAELQSKIATSQSNIEKAQQAINNARGTLSTLSPTCPSWYIQQFVGNYGSQYPGSVYATEAAKLAWTQQYNSQKAQCEGTISAGNSKIQTEQTNISIYNTAISTRTTQYNNDVSALKVKYGIT